MGSLSYLISTVGVAVMAFSASVLYFGRVAVDELDSLIPCGHLALRHPGIGLGLGIALFIAGRSIFDKRSSILRPSPWR